ncbi:MAG: hypothetical protein IPM21_14850 [Acidobacteria bacterium]|nr:hypothetical protein [Acidobacteriota bacterium]
MKFGVFEAMAKEEAQEYLEEFLAFGKGSAIEILEQNLHFSDDVNFTVESLPNILKALIPTLRTIPKEADPNVPEFIRKTEDYKKGLFDFDDTSKLVVLAAGYYLGETFVRSFPLLKWTTGNIELLEGNMPVVAPFKNSIEMSPIMVIENLFAGVVSGIRQITAVDRAIVMWVNLTP